MKPWRSKLMVQLKALWEKREAAKALNELKFL